jgi:hypothetical protein
MSSCLRSLTHLRDRRKQVWLEHGGEGGVARDEVTQGSQSVGKVKDMEGLVE